MGRVKKSKQNIVLRNRKNLSKRYVNPLHLVATVYEDGSGDHANVDNEVMSLDNARPSTSTANSSYDEPVEKVERPTGFALAHSYRPNVLVDENAPSYILVDVNQLKTFLEGFSCPKCAGAIMVSQSKPIGYANLFYVKCKECSYESRFDSSVKTDQNNETAGRKSFEVNRRIVQGFSSIGKGFRGMEAFSMAMNMKSMSSKAYNCHIKQMHDKYVTVANDSMEKARIEVRKAYSVIDNISLDEMEKIINISVSFDGSWQKRGFTSKNGVGCCIDVVTGLVIDFEVLSKYCRLCSQKEVKLGKESVAFMDWYKEHKPKCQKNFDGSSPAMEPEAAERIWKRSEKNGFRYTTLVSDGDSKTFSHLNDLKVYPDLQITKVECLNHVAKRLGTGLRKIVSDNSGTGAPLGGKTFGSLKGTTIEKLTNYYRNAIQNNLGDVEKMKTAIYATLSHCSSTDKTPKHGKCPRGEDSWCFYNKAIAKNEKPESHKTKIKTPLNERVVSKILPLYQRLASNALLERCVSGKTQNANEALHGVIWTKCPKTTFASRNKLEMEVCAAICQYNCGYNQTMPVLQRAIGLSPGQHTQKRAKAFDESRLRLAETRKKKKFAEYRRKLRQAQILEEERKKSREGVTYGAGEF